MRQNWDWSVVDQKSVIGPAIRSQNHFTVTPEGSCSVLSQMLF